MPTTVFLLAGGLTLLVLGAELLIRGASRLALRIGIPSLVVGLTVVAYGTSTPELVVSAKAALSGQADLALGNVLGSNIFNILFILGASALISPLIVSRAIIWREVPVMIAASLLLWAMATDGRVSRFEGGVLVGILLLYTTYQVWTGLRQGAETSSVHPKKTSVALNIFFILLGLACLILGARWLLDSSVQIARGLGVSELIIGLTIVAIGTSLPEVATSLLATWRGEREIAIGNVVGSNIYNVVGVLGLAAWIAPKGIAVSSAALNFDFPIMIAATVACLPIFWTGHRIARWEGALFLFYYAAYTLFLILNSKKHDALPAFSGLMLWVVLPLTLVTLLVGMARHVKKPNKI
ncbi:MAG: calcium/sodium antiporter [Elusimicrobia bacterium]|nr:calcium/sodium antiporter [Elusimicrobiota bacterium]